MQNATPADLHGMQAKQYMLQQPCWFAGVAMGFPQEHLDRIKSEFPSDPIDVLYHADDNMMYLWVFGEQSGPVHLLTIFKHECVGTIIDRLRESRHNAQHRDWRKWLVKTKTDMKAAEKATIRKAVEAADPDAVARELMVKSGNHIRTTVAA